jgi:hypothetical protein
MLAQDDLSSPTSSSSASDASAASPSYSVSVATTTTTDDGDRVPSVPATPSYAPESSDNGLATTSPAASPSNGLSSEPTPAPAPTSSVRPPSYSAELSQATTGQLPAVTGGPISAPSIDVPTPPVEPTVQPLIGPPAPGELASPAAYPLPGATPDPRHRRPERQRGAEGKRPSPEGRWIGHRLRHIGPWSVVKVAALFYLCLFLSFVVASVLLWNVGRSTETIDQFEGFVTRLGAYGTCTPEGELDPGTAFERDDDCPDGEVLIEGFKLEDGVLFRVLFFGGVVIVVGGTIGTTLLVVLFNLLNDVTGGIRYTTVREPSPAAAGGPSGGPPSRSPRHQSRR